jgi:hypothetical protein
MIARNPSSVDSQRTEVVSVMGSDNDDAALLQYSHIEDDAE